MNKLKRAAVLTRLMEELRKRGSWCGETHVQKSCFFLQKLMEVPLGFDFILYKHGPFSFDLRDELTCLRADNLIRLEPQWPYGPKLVPTDLGKHIQEICQNTVQMYDDHIAFVADKLGAKDVSCLERLATALFVTLDAEKGASVDERSRRLTELKPHISHDEAKAAVEEVDQFIEEAQGRAR